MGDHRAASRARDPRGRARRETTVLDGDGVPRVATLGDEDVFVEPVRIVQNWNKLGELNENDPFVVMECIPQIFPINGIATPVSPGTTFEHTTRRVRRARRVATVQRTG